MYEVAEVFLSNTNADAVKEKQILNRLKSSSAFQKNNISYQRRGANSDEIISNWKTGHPLHVDFEE